MSNGGIILTVLIEIAALVKDVWKGIPIEPKCVFQKVAVSIVFCLIVMEALLWRDINIIFIVLSFFWRHPCLFAVFIFSFACVPPMIVYYEYKKILEL